MSAGEDPVPEEHQDGVIAFAEPPVSVPTVNSIETPKCATVSVLVICAGGAEHLGNRLNTHQAADHLSSRPMVLRFVPRAKIQVVAEHALGDACVAAPGMHAPCFRMCPAPVHF